MSNSYRIMLRVIIFTVSIALSCAIGVTVRSIRSLQHPRTISLCEVARDPGKYNQKTIRIRASSWVTSSDIYRSIVLFDTSCNTGVEIASVELDNSYNPAAEVDALLNYPREEIRKADVIVLGKFDQAGFSVTAIPDKKKQRGFRIADADGYATDFYIDPANGRVMSFLINYNGYVFGTEHKKFKDVEGVLIPSNFSQRLEMTQGAFFADYNVKDIKLNNPLGDDVFAMP